MDPLLCLFTQCCIQFILIFHIIFCYFILFDILIQAQTDGQIDFRLDLESGTAVETHFVCYVYHVLRQKEIKLVKMSASLV